jgi:hypothetical protein
MESSRNINLHLILTIFLGFGMVLFGVLAVVAFRDNETTQAGHTKAVAAARAEAAKQQKEKDDTEAIKANELPYRTFTAQPIDGGFSFQIPKNWSLYVGRSAVGKTQLDLAADPDAVVYNLGASAINSHAFKVQLLRTTPQEVVKTFDDKIKKKMITSKGANVSGISGTWLEGSIDDQRHNGVIIILPLRDKTLTISTDDRKYLSEFNTILAAAKIIP